jgi:hypothetical protein
VIQALKDRLRWCWQHRTKALGLAALGIAYVQNNLAQVGHFMSAQWQGGILAVFGVLAFVIGLYNTFALREPPP